MVVEASLANGSIGSHLSVRSGKGALFPAAISWTPLESLNLALLSPDYQYLLEYFNIHTHFQCTTPSKQHTFSHHHNNGNNSDPTLPPRPDPPPPKPPHTNFHLRPHPQTSLTNTRSTLKSDSTYMSRLHQRPLPPRPFVSRPSLRPQRRTQRHRPLNLQALPARPLQEGRRVRVRTHFQLAG